MGAHGKYQYLSLVLWCLFWFITGNILLGTPFLFYQANYTCTEYSSNSECHDFVCNIEDEAERKPYIKDP